MTVPIQNLRSGTADKRPDPSNLANGQIAIQYNDSDPAVFFKGSSGALIKVAPTFVGPNAPNSTPGTGGFAGNSVGETWLDTSVTPPLFKVFDGTSFVLAGGAGGGGATGGGTDEVVIEFDKTVSTSYTITSGKNALTVGPLEIATGATLTVPADSTLLVL